MASFSTSSVQKSFKYDVFLSFRGEDTRKTFIDHLYLALEKEGINTYKDDEKIEKGKRIMDELTRSIEDSKLYIIVFSKNYVSSSWCLNELVKIMECLNMNEHFAYPIFYDVEPTDICKQTGPVKRAFAKHRKEKAAWKWRDAMKVAAGLAGWELKAIANGHEAKFIQKIVKVISLELRCTDSGFYGKLVGMEDRVKHVVSSLEIGIDDVRMIGIKGMGGGGKTTLARAIFEKISIWFEGSSFVDNVREISNDSSNGLKSLQKQILSDVLNDQVISVKSVSDVKKMLRGRKILLVLDDVDHIDQLEALAGELNWFKPGSRIIITTRDKQVLLAHKVNFISDVNLLSNEEAMCLLSRYAFGTQNPIQGYEELSEKVVSYAAGLPLTLKVLGSFLSGKSHDVWTDALERLKTVPLEETRKKHELSYNDLEDDYKEIFLNVACMLKGWEKDRAIRALESCGYHAKIGLEVLEQKSLITLYNNSCGDWVLGMHDHIVEMGKHTVRRLHPNEPHKHSQLWINEEIEVILANGLGTEATRCIHLVKSKLHPATIIKGLGNMKKLQFLHVEEYCWREDNDFLEENWESYVYSEYIPNGLRCLTWKSYPFNCLAKLIHAKVLDKLKFLNLSYSKLRTLDFELIPSVETLELLGCTDLLELDMRFGCQKLRILDLSCSWVRALYFGPTPNLEVLSLKGCNDLEELHMPDGNVKLKSFYICCSKLRTLDLSQTQKLEKLDICGCKDLVELHMPHELESLGIRSSRLRTLNLVQIPNLKEIEFEECDLVELIMPVESLKLRSLQLNGSNLRTLDLMSTPNLEILRLQELDNLVELHMPVESPKLKHLELSNSKFKTLDLARTPNLETLYLYGSDHLVEHQMQSLCSLGCLRELILCGGFQEVPIDLHRLKYLEKLILSSRKIKHIPRGICMLKHLKVLRLLCCWLLEQLPEDLGRLECLEDLYLSCRKIKHLPNSICMLKHLKVLTLPCMLLEQLPEDLGRLECLQYLDIKGAGVTQLPLSIFQMKGLYIYGSRSQLESYGFKSFKEESKYGAGCYI